MALTLSFTDNADSTGATATVSGADSALVTIYTARIGSFDFGMPDAWNASGTRTGNGTVNLSLSPAYYWAYATGTVSGNPATSVPQRFAATRSNTSILTKILDAVVASLQEISFKILDAGVTGGIDLTNIRRLRALDEKVISAYGVPLIGVFTPDQETQPGTTTQQDDIGYPVLISVIDTAPVEESGRDDSYLKWREQIRRKFINQRLDTVGIPQQFFALWEPKLVFYHPPEMAEMMRSTQGFRFVTREPRGV